MSDPRFEDEDEETISTPPEKSWIAFWLVTTVFVLTMLLCTGCTLYKRSTYVLNWEGRHVDELVEMMGCPTIAQSDHYMGQMLTYRIRTSSTRYRPPKVTFFRFWIDKYGYIYRWRVE